MTLKELIKKNKLEKKETEIYIAMYNNLGKRFYGAFVSDSTNLTDYYDMEVDEFEPFNKSKTIYTARFPKYEYPLGLDSMRVQWDKAKSDKQAREKREQFNETTKRRRKK